MDPIPKSVKVAIAAASRDILDAMRGSGVRSIGNSKTVVATMEKFMVGMITGAYSRTKSDWVEASDGDSWIERSASADNKNLQNQLADYIRENESVTKDMLIADTGGDASLAHQWLTKFFTDKASLEKENPEIVKIISDMVAGNPGFTHAPVAPKAPTPVAPATPGAVKPVIPASPMEQLPALSEISNDKGKKTEEDVSSLVKPIDPSKFSLGHPGGAPKKEPKKDSHSKEKPLELVPESDQFTGGHGLSGKEERV